MPGLAKQWRRSGKVHSRVTHDLMDGEVVDADAHFKVPNPGGGVDLMLCPHDPAAPAEQVINCGCIALPYMRKWRVMHPGAKPFTATELARDPGKAYLDSEAKKVGRRLEPVPDAGRATIPPGKLAGYSLNPDHPSGGHKARVIRAVLGYGQADAEAFGQQLLAGLPRGRQARQAGRARPALRGGYSDDRAVRQWYRQIGLDHQISRCRARASVGAHQQGNVETAQEEIRHIMKTATLRFADADTVVSRVAVPAQGGGEAIRPGQLGVIVLVTEQPRLCYLVEFLDSAGEVVGTHSMLPNQIAAWAPELAQTDA